jgi:pilus assembly protein TadC
MKQILIACIFLALPWVVCGESRKRLNAGIFETETSGLGRIAIPVVMELVVAALQTGVSIPRALLSVGQVMPHRTGDPMIRAARQLELGASWASAWRNVTGDLIVIADALKPAWNDGAAPSESLKAAMVTVRHKRQALSKLAASKLAVRMVLPLGLCLLPAFVLIGLVPVMLSLGSRLMIG